jgi:hypothetical protein
MKTFLRARQLAELQSEKATLEKQLQNPYIQDKGAVGTQLRRLTQDIETQAPPEIKGPELDKIVKREKELREEIMVGMPCAEEMRRCPPGAIGRHTKWEKRNKNKILEWKNCQLILNRESDDPDVANVERLRPIGSPNVNLDNAMIPGKVMSFPTEQFKEGHDRVFTAPEPESVSEDAEIDRLKAEVAELRLRVQAEKKKPRAKRKAGPGKRLGRPPRQPEPGAPVQAEPEPQPEPERQPEPGPMQEGV